MTPKKEPVSKGTFSFTSSNGENTSLTFVMPHTIAAKIAIDIMTWKDNSIWTATDYEKYQEEEKEFLSKLKT